MPTKRYRQPPPKLFWKHVEILDALRDEHPDWDEGQLREKAHEINMGLHAFDERARRHNRRTEKHERLVGLRPGRQ
jgi:hypothetical protein